MKNHVLFLTAILLSVPVLAQFTLQGTVKSNYDGQPLYGAHIEILTTGQNTVSDQKGNFSFPKVKKGKIELRTSFLGHSPDVRQLDLNKDLTLDILLTVSPVMSDEVIITSTRADEKTPVAFQDLSKKEIDQKNFGQDLPMLLAGSISTVATSDAGNGMGYTALRIRGTDMTRINVTMNGIPLNDPESHNVFWVDLPDIASSTDNIQIQRGVGTSTNGASAFGASINLQSLKFTSDPYGEINTSYGSFNSMKNSLAFGSGLLQKHWTIDGRFSRLHSDGYIDRAFSDLRSGFLSAAFADSKTVVRFNYITGAEKTYQAWDGIPHEVLDTNRRYNGMGMYFDSKGKLRFYDDETDNYSQTHYQFLLSRQLQKQLVLNLAAHYTHGEGYYEQFRDDDKLADYGIPAIHLPGNYYVSNGDTLIYPDSLISSCDLIRRKWLNNDFKGITYSLNWNPGALQTTLGGSWNTYTGRHFGRVIWSEVALNTPPDLEWYRSRAVKNDFNLYGKLNYALTSSLNAFVDLQYRKINYEIEGIDDDSRNITQEHQYSFFNPKAGLHFDANTLNSVYLSFAMAKREPNRDNFVDANPEKPVPVPETLFDLEAGHQLRTGTFTMTTNLYFMYYRDQLALTGAINDVGAPVMENVPESYRLGIELAGSVMLPFNLKWNGSATLSRNKITKFTEYVDDWDTWGQVSFVHRNTNLSFSPSLLVSSEFTWNITKKANVALLSRYVGKQYLDNTQDESRRLDPYLVNDIRLSYTLTTSLFRQLSLRFMLNNVLNEKYESNAWVYRYFESGEARVLDGYFPQAGFNLMGGLAINF